MASPLDATIIGSAGLLQSTSAISLLTSSKRTTSSSSLSDVSKGPWSSSASITPETPDSELGQLISPLEFWRTQIVPPASCLSLNRPRVTPDHGTHSWTSVKPAWRKLRVGPDQCHASRVLAALSLISIASARTNETGFSISLGHPASILPFRVTSNADTTVQELLDGVEATLTSILSHRHAQPPCQTSGHPQFDTVLDLSSLLQASKGGYAISGSDRRPHLILKTYLEHNNTTVKLEANFDPTHVSHDSAVALLCQLDEILYQLASKPPTSTIHTLCSLGHKDLVQIQAWKKADIENLPRPSPTCVHDTVASWAEKTPDAEAIDAWDVRLSFRELDTVSSALARHLMSQYGMRQGDKVPLHMDRSGLAIVCMLAVVKTGAAFVPLDPANPRERNEGIVETCKAGRILLQPDLADPIPLCPNKAESTLITWGLLNSLPPDTAWELPTVAPDSLAYTIFTSGSTGRPKGVMVEHRNLSHSLAAHGGSILRQGPESRVLQFASPAFDASITEHLAPLSNGGCVCVPDAEDRMAGLAGFINAHSVNWCFLTPSFVKLLSPEDVPGLTTVVLGGEAITNDCIDRWAARTRLINGYGPTENTIAATACVVDPDPSTRDRASIGQGITCRTWVVDAEDHTRLLPIGEIGELVLQGPSVARGYLDDEEKTKAAFVEVPWWGLNDNGECVPDRVYKTGDLVRYLSDGSLYYLGRKDTQVKVRGQRLELSEVELQIPRARIPHAIASVPKGGAYAGTLVVVMAAESAPGSGSSGGIQLLEGEAARGALEAAAEARVALSTVLPVFAVPDIWLPIQTMPLNTSAKADRQAIARWLESVETREAGKDPAEEALVCSIPETKIERVIQDAWAHVLGLPCDRVALDRSFQSLGGDSIRAVQALGRCRPQNIRFTVRRVLEGASIRQLAAESRRHDRAGVASGEESAEPLHKRFPLSPVQRIYAHRAPGSPHFFNQTCVIHLKKQFNPDQVLGALIRLVDAHSMLRARLVKTRSKEGITFAQEITKDVKESLLFNHHAVLSLQHAEAVVQASQHRVDIQSGPVLVADMIQVGENQTLLSLVVSHFSIDIVSWTVILEDLNNLLFTPESPLVSTLPFQTWTWEQATEWERIWSKQETLPYSLPLVDLDELWSVRPEDNTYGNTMRCEFRVPIGGLIDQCRTTSVSVLDVFIASLFLGFVKSFPERDLRTLSIFNEGHGREPWRSEQDISRTVGWFTAATPIVLPPASIATAERPSSLWYTTLRVRHVRQKILSGGLPFQASRHGSEPMEIVFNYMGQQLMSDDSKSAFEVLPEFRGDGGDHASDNMGRFSLFEISAQVGHNNEAKFTFVWPRTAKHQDSIHDWIHSTSQTLRLGIGEPLSMPPSCDISHMPVDYDLCLFLLQRAQSKIEEAASNASIVRMCPASTIQRAMLQAQKKGPHPDAYLARLLLSVQPSSGATKVNPRRLIKAWKQVVARHEILRTAFVVRPDPDSSEFDQVVLDPSVSPRTEHIVLDFDTVPSEESRNTLSLLPGFLHQLSEHDIPHTFTIFTTQNNPHQTLIVFECTHAIIDHHSLQTILRDLNKFYLDSDADTPTANAPQYSDLTTYTSRENSSGSNSPIWLNLFSNEPHPTGHLFPALGLPIASNTKPGKHSKIPSVAFTPALIFRFAWAVLLSRRLSARVVSFGHVLAGRDTVDVEGIEAVVGPCLNIVGCVARFGSEEQTVGEMLGELARQFLQGMEEQRTFLEFAGSFGSDVGGEAGRGMAATTTLFDTLVNFRRHIDSDYHTVELGRKGEEGLVLKALEEMDPFDYAIVVEIDHHVSGGMDVALSIWDDVVAETLVAELVREYRDILMGITVPGALHQRVSQLGRW
ncbi:Nonribosomal peptide synthetase 1 [Madurella mycetomatis]|uniref:Nonribosomal peptide synthetase 1 n=1 Tax=Madurella mycetomatis TaxID=100816 RepID=A0A175VV53_9PEZI|nr:Nonribosomal peptide synthetase 1 [Madurella mycetomatis]